MKTTFVMLGAIAAIAAVEGCSSSKSDAPPDLGHFAEYMASSYCGALQGCCQQRGFAYDPASCETQMAYNYQISADAAKRGKVIYDGAAAQRCASAIRDNLSRCGGGDAGMPSTVDDDPMHVACKPVFVGTMQPGQPCESSEECASPTGTRASCDGTPSPGGSITAHVCRQMKDAPLGQPCGRLDADGYVLGECDAKVGFCKTTDGRFDGSGTCTAYAKVGDACSAGANTAACEPGTSTCDPTTQRCVALPGVGQPCAPYAGLFSCAPGLYCDHGLQTGSGTCAPAKPIGAACTMSIECATSVCATGADGTTTCAAYDAIDISPRSCGFGPEAQGPEDAGIQPPPKGS